MRVLLILQIMLFSFNLMAVENSANEKVEIENLMKNFHHAFERSNINKLKKLTKKEFYQSMGGDKAIKSKGKIKGEPKKVVKVIYKQGSTDKSLFFAKFILEGEKPPHQWFVIEKKDKAFKIISTISDLD